MRGLIITTPSAGITGTNVGMLVIGTVTLSAGGAALDLAGAGNPAVSVFFDSLTSSGGTNNVALTNLGGTVNLGALGGLSGATGHAFVVSGGAANVTYGGTIAATVAAARAVSVTNATGGTIAFNGAVASSGTSAGVFLNNNAGATINFTGGLALSTGANAAFTATSGGTVSATQDNTTIVNTLATTTATALNVANTTIGGAGLTFRSIASNGGTASGVIVDNTGASGTLTVTGNGAAGTGGTIANKTGTDGLPTTGVGIYLNNTLNPSFSRMQLNDFGNYAIRGLNVAGFTLADSVVSGVNGTADNVGGISSPEGSIAFGTGQGEFSGPVNGLTGTANLTNTSVSGGFADNVRVFNQSGTLVLGLSSVTIGANSTANGNDGVLIEPQGTAVIQATVDNSSFTAARGDLLQYVDNGTGSGQSLTVTNSTFSNNHPAIATGGGGVTILSGTNNNLALTMSGNSFRDAVGTGVLIVKPTGTGTLSGSFTNNTIGVSGLANSGSAEGSGLKLQTVGQGTVTMAITNNTIRQYNNFGIELLAGGAASAQDGTFNTTITGNLIDQPGNTAGTITIPKQGIHLNIGTVPGDTYFACSVITGNNIGASGADSVPPSINVDFRLRQRQSTNIRLPGYGGATTDTTAVTNFIIANNPTGAPNGLVQVNSPPGGGYIGGAPCP